MAEATEHDGVVAEKVRLQRLSELFPFLSEKVRLKRR